MEKYDLYMDNECIPLCDALNEIPGIETYESCCGHSLDNYRVYMKVSSLRGLRVLGRCTSRNYSSGIWRVVIDNADCPSPEVAYVYLESKKPLEADEMALETAALEKSLRYWMERI